MKPEELRGLSLDELRQKEREAREDLFRLRLKRRTNQLNDTAALGKARRELARILTIRRERELSAGVELRGGES